MTVGLGHYLAVGAILFTLGILGIFLNRKNIIVILMSIELILLAVNINLVAFSTFLGDIVGQVFAMLVLTVAAAETAIGLAVLVVYFRNPLEKEVVFRGTVVPGQDPQREAPVGEKREVTPLNPAATIASRIACSWNSGTPSVFSSTSRSSSFGPPRPMRR